MKRINVENKIHRITSNITDKELRKLDEICQEMGTNRAELIRNRLLFPDMLLIDHSRILIALNHIGLEMAKINRAIDQNALTESTSEHACERFNTLFASYQKIQERLESELRTMLARIIKKK